VAFMADLYRYLPRLEFNVRAQFEPVSGLIFLNVDFATFCKAGANCVLGTATEGEKELTSAINHEWYHYFQTIANGYQYQYASEMWRTIIELKQEARRPIHSADDSDDDSSEDALRMPRSPDFAKEMQEIDPHFAERMRGIRGLVKETDQAKDWERDPPGSDFSVLSAREPALAQAFDKLWAGTTLPNAEGLSVMHLIEGSAIVYEHAANPSRDGLEDRLAEVWHVHGDMYRRAYEMTQRACGPRALDIILPAAALALRYTNPANAFPFFLEWLNSSLLGSEIAEARRIAERPPGIDSAGPYLGTACDVREKQRDRPDRYQIYDDVLDDLAKRGSGVDEIDLMADPSALLKLPSFPAEMVAKDVPMRGKVGVDELARRLQLGNLVLRTSKLPRYRRDLDQRLSERFQPLRAWLVDPRQGADEYARLAIKSAMRGDLDQGQLHWKTALGIYESIGDKEGISDACFSLGVLYAQRDDFKRADEMYRKSLEVSKDLGNLVGVARAVGNVGGLCYLRHNLDQAELLIREALDIYQRLGLNEGIAMEHLRLGRISQERGDLVQSEELLAKALSIYAEVRNSDLARATKALLEEVRKARHDSEPLA
jgi:tetratricopeptide (TPR) repeat protein